MVDATQAIHDRWNAEDSVGWTTFHQVAEELDEIEYAGVISVTDLVTLRAFYEGRRSENA